MTDVVRAEVGASDGDRTDVPSGADAGASQTDVVTRADADTGDVAIARDGAVAAGPRPARPSVVATDVSILYPPPMTRAQATAMVEPSASGAFGTLVERATVDTLVARTSLRSIDYTRLRLVSVRLDPCSRARVADASCRAELRLVFQEVNLDVTEPLILDTGLHAIYTVAPDEFLATLDELIGLRAADAPADAPLDVHPSMVREGVLGPYAMGVQRVLLAHVGQRRLARVAVMGSHLAAWDFAASDVGASGATPVPIAGAAALTENFEVDISTAPPGEHFNGLAFTLGGATRQTPVRLVDDASVLWDSHTAPMRSPADQWAAYEAALRTENPTRRGVDEVDCASCHFAQSARRYADRALGFATRASVQRYDGAPAALLVNRTTAPRSSLRQFGYAGFGLGGRLVVIGQRTVNDTAATVTRLRAGTW